MKAIAVIPARYNSSRFPGKPLAEILGKPMIQWVYEGVSKAEKIESVYVATDDTRIFDCVERFDGNAIMTGDCHCGTDRVYQASKGIDCDVIINVQGDEPMIVAQEIDDLVSLFENDNVQMATLRKRITDTTEIDNPNIVKIVVDLFDNALYFSRSRIPFAGRARQEVYYYRHIGIYGYRKDFLKQFVELEESPNERIEKLEQMRALDNGFKIKTMETQYEGIGVDIKEDIGKVEMYMKNRSVY